MSRKFLKHLPNALTISRAGLGFGILYCGITQKWTLGFWLMVAALLTDFLDGLAAKKLHAESELGAALDPIVDCLLCACGMLGLYAAGRASLLLIGIMGASAVLIGYVKFYRRDRPRLQRAIQSLSVGYLFIVWTVITWNFATLAFGWHVLYPVLTAALLAGAAHLKRHRLKAWYGWLQS